MYTKGGMFYFRVRLVKLRLNEDEQIIGGEGRTKVSLAVPGLISWDSGREPSLIL